MEYTCTGVGNSREERYIYLSISSEILGRNVRTPTAATAAAATAAAAAAAKTWFDRYPQFF